jgi:glycosyltransferase involved in cell wall biosynthesis
VTLWLDVEDLFDYAAANDRPSGIQRLSFELYQALIDLSGEGEVRFCRHDPDLPTLVAVEWSEVCAVYAGLARGRDPRIDPAAPAPDRPKGRDIHELALNGDSLLCLGSPWFKPGHGDIIRALRATLGLRVGILIYDLIPIFHPEWCDADLVEIFQEWYCAIIPHADAVFAISNATIRDMLRWAEQENLSLRGPVTALPIGTGFTEDKIKRREGRDLPFGLSQGSYVLLVSTIEARKNHLLAFRVWRRLLARMKYDDVPTLVFAGRIGWLVADLMQQIENAHYLDGKLIVLEEVDDATLSALYRGCRFTLFPSLYEGWGLPVTESLGYGKVCLASNRTAVPEAGGSFCLYFDPDNLNDATDTIQSAIEDPAEIAIMEARIKADFRPTPWLNAAATLLERMRVTPMPGEEPTFLTRKPRTSLPTTLARRQLFLDVSEIVQRDAKTGIQRVVRAIVQELCKNPPPGDRVVPVYLTYERGGWRYRHARQWTQRLIGNPFRNGGDEPIRWYDGDRLLIADFNVFPALGAAQSGLLQRLRSDGVQISFVLYDLLPMQMPELIHPGVGLAFADWLTALATLADGVICISRTVAEDMRLWLSVALPDRLASLRIEWFHLGADLDASAPTQGMPADFMRALVWMRSAPTFLMVGTLEPRKGHLQAIEAFDRLWRMQIDVNLVIVGRAGWMDLPDEHRKNIPLIEDRLRSHPELGGRLLWFEDASDELLEKLYATGTCLIAASEGEGFGLPLIEAARHGVPIIARDMPVFREVAGEHAFYFIGLGSRSLAKAVEHWLVLNEKGQAPSSARMPRLTWSQSAEMLIDRLEGLSA